MSVSITTDIFCDGDDCLNWINGATGNRIKTNRAREEARKHGWQRVFLDHKCRWIDVCPECFGEHNY